MGVCALSWPILAEFEVLTRRKPQSAQRRPLVSFLSPLPQHLPYHTVRGPVWSCCCDGKSNCSIETQRRAFGHLADLEEVTSAQCSECEGEVVLSSTGKRRE